MTWKITNAVRGLGSFIPLRFWEKVRGNSGRRPNIALRALVVVLTPAIIFGIPASAFVLAIHQIRGGWDDGAITAAFSRTLAEAGRFALTPVSAKVEGFSSLSWLLLLTVPNYFFKSPVASLIWMKLLSAAAFLLSLVVFRRIALRLLATVEQADMATILTAFLVPPVLETLNGMEMNFYMLLVLCLVHVLTNENLSRHRNILIWGLTSALIITRFESPFLIVFLATGLLSSRDRTSLIHLASSAGSAFLVVELWRFFQFRSWMPNTVYAKMLPPYSPPHLMQPMLMTRIAAESEIVQVLGGLLFVTLLVAAGTPFLRRTTLPQWFVTHRRPLSVLFFGVVWISYRNTFHNLVQYVLASRHETLILASLVLLAVGVVLNVYVFKHASRTEKSVAALAAAGVMFGIIFGKNWGYDGRMILPCLPFLILSVVLFLERRIPSEHWRNTALVTCILLQMFVWGKAVEGAWRKGDPVPVSMIEKTGRAADAVRSLAGLDSLSIMVPDVGGSALCCERLEILDSALLTNPYLARRGYQAFDQYLHDKRPQVIESHGYWSINSRVYKSDVMSEYKLAVIDQTRLLLRNDIFLQVYRSLEAGTGVHVGFGSECLGDVEAGVLDMEFVRSRRECLYVSRDDLGRIGIATRYSQVR